MMRHFILLFFVVRHEGLQKLLKAYVTSETYFDNHYI